MSAQVIALTTVDRFDVAERLAHELVERRLAACVNILGPARSIYRWKGAVEVTEEKLLIIKTVQDNLERVRDTITRMSSYELPEFVVLDITDGDENYLNWLSAQCASVPEGE